MNTNAPNHNLMPRMASLIENSAQSLRLASIINVVFVFIIFIVLAVAISYNHFSQTDNDLKVKYFNGMLLGTLLITLISAMLGIWLVIASNQLKKTCNSSN